MQSKSESANPLQPDPPGVPTAAVYSEPWWRGFAYNAISRELRVGNASNSSSMDCPNGSESNDGHSLSNGGMNDEDDAKKETQTTASSHSVGNSGRGHQNMQPLTSTIPPVSDERLAQAPQLELVGHSIACASGPYQDPYHASMMAAYGHQSLGYPPYVGMAHARMPLPIEMAQEPVYVNAKQYQGILRRRQARAKAELEKKAIKVRKPYLHESRHQHAMRRARASGGRFAKKSDVDGPSNITNEQGHSSGHAHSASSSGSEPLQSDSGETWNSSVIKQSRRPPDHSTHHVNSNRLYQNRG